MYALLAFALHLLIGGIAASAIAPHSIDPTANEASLWTLALASAVISMLGMVATASYLAKRIAAMSGLIIGLACGVLCSILLGLTMRGTDYSLVLYLTILSPTLLAVLLATLLDRPKTGWQT